MRKTLALVVMLLACTPCSAKIASLRDSSKALDNAHMKAIFEADQADRTSLNVDWDSVNTRDAKRRSEVRQLMGADTLKTGLDYEEAAFVFQHADDANDYLLAHTLALVAVSKGRQKALWISAATLDRYLQEIGQKQIFGTQYLRKKANTSMTQEPYDRTLVSDALRKELGVPLQREQKTQLAKFEAQRLALEKAQPAGKGAAKDAQKGK